jgi:uncharacterized membrane protein
MAGFCASCGSPLGQSGCCGGCGDAAPPPASAGLTENAAGALCYIAGLVTGILFLVIAPYNRNPRIKFHAVQSILLSLTWILAWSAILPLSMLLPFGLSLAFSLFSLVLCLLLMWKAYQGQTLSLPLIGSIARQQAAKMIKTQPVNRR